MAIITTSLSIPARAHLPRSLTCTLQGEQALAATLLRLRFTDLISADPVRRASAMGFWRDQETVDFWVSVLGLPVSVVRRCVAQAVEVASVLDTQPHQLALFAGKVV